jgi:membrane-bound lytic murein transglycosylase F
VFPRHGQISLIRNRYLGFQKVLNDSDRTHFFKDRLTLLKSVLPHFKKYATEFDLPWELLAAVAYQESHWNNDARSPTGVRGIMQLTRSTALHLGLEDREDLEQSLMGGAKYLRALLDQQPVRLHKRDRIALALLAYNSGIGHLHDAQELAIASGRNPFSFWELRTIFPLLSNPAIADDLEFGVARGDEPVQFANRVLAFYDLLADRTDGL